MKTIFQYGILLLMQCMLSSLACGQEAKMPADSTIRNCSNCCCSRDLSPVSSMISHIHNKGEWMVSYRMMWMQMHGNYQDGKSIANSTLFNSYLMVPHQMQMQMHMLMGMVGVTNRLTLMAMLNFNNTKMTMQMPEMQAHDHSHDEHDGHGSDGHGHDMHTTGFGDTKIHAVYALISANNHQLIASLGASIPTGSITYTGHDGMYANSRLPYAMQQGSGSVEALPAISYLYYKNKFSWGAQVGYNHRLHSNRIGYRLGNELYANAWAAYQLWDWLGLSGKVDGLNIASIRHKDLSLFDGMEPAANSKNYGGNVLSLSGGFNFFVFKQRLSIEAGLPVYQRWNGIQMNRTVTLFAGWQMVF